MRHFVESICKSQDFAEEISTHIWDGNSLNRELMTRRIILFSPAKSWDLQTGTLYMQIRDQLGQIYEDQSFADLFSHCGQPAEVPWRLALVCIFQFIEDLPDRQAAEAVRQRIDWKYALGLQLAD